MLQPRMPVEKVGFGRGVKAEATGSVSQVMKVNPQSLPNPRVLWRSCPINSSTPSEDKHRKRQPLS